MKNVLILKDMIDQPIKKYPSYVDTIEISNSFFFYLSIQKVSESPILIDSKSIKSIKISESTFQSINTLSSGALNIAHNANENINTNLIMNSFQIINFYDCLFCISNGLNSHIDRNQLCNLENFDNLLIFLSCSNQSDIIETNHSKSFMKDYSIKVDEKFMGRCHVR